MAKVALVSILIGIVAVPDLIAGGCGHYFQKVVAVPVVAAVPVYQVGTDLEIKAAVEKALREREAYAAQQALKQQQQGLRDYQQQQWEAERRQPEQPTSTSYSPNQIAPTVVEKCGRCHAGPNSSAGGSFNLSSQLTGEQFFRITDMIANKTDVPAQMTGVINNLKPEEYGKLLDEFIKLKKVGSVPKVVSNFSY